MREQMGPAILLAGRSALGVGLGAVAATFCIAVAWGLFIFSGSQSLIIWLASLMFSAGIGAWAGSQIAWLQLDGGNSSRSFAMAIPAVVIGTISAWIGFYYGSNQEFECCAMPTVTPVYYTVIGATIGANLSVISASFLKRFIDMKVRTQIREDAA